MVGKDLHVIAELAKCRSGCATGQAGTDDQDGEFTAVQRGDQVHVVFVVIPHIPHRDALWFRVVQDLAWGDPIDDRVWLAELFTSRSISVAHNLTF